jgi:hypothetical protein
MAGKIGFRRVTSQIRKAPVSGLFVAGLASEPG